MKPHHIAALFLFICGGLLAYTIHQKNPDGAIRWAIILYLFGTIIFFYEKLPRWLRPIVVVLPVIGAGRIAYVHFTNGNIVLAVVTCIALITVGAPMLNRDSRPSRKQYDLGWNLLHMLGLLFHSFRSLCGCFYSSSDNKINAHVKN